MLIAVKIIGVLLVVLGLGFFLNPKLIRQLMSFVAVGKRIYAIGILRLLLGALFLLAASECRLIGVMVTLGIIILVSGILIFILGLARIKKIIAWWQARTLLIMRLCGIIGSAFGILILYSV